MKFKIGDIITRKHGDGNTWKIVNINNEIGYEGQLISIGKDCPIYGRVDIGQLASSPVDVIDNKYILVNGLVESIYL